MSTRYLGSLSTLKNAIHVYTDGACAGNPGPMGIGVVLVDPLYARAGREIHEYLGHGTNNIAELRAILTALRLLPQDRAAVICTDSEYCIGVLAHGYKAKANQELVAEVRQVLAGLPNVYFHKVAAHSGIKHNERADQLARASAMRAPVKEPTRPPSPAPETKVAAPDVAALAARIEWLLCQDHRFNPPENAEQEADIAWRRGRYEMLKSSSRPFEESARQATTEWLERVIGQVIVDRSRREVRSMEVLHGKLRDLGFPVAVEVAWRQAYREINGPEEYNDGWLLAFEQGGERAVQAFVERKEREDEGKQAEVPRSSVLPRPPA